MSDIFEKLKRTGTKIAETTAKTAGDLMEKGKTQVNKIAIENELAKAQRQLGIYVYECSKGAPSDAEVMESLLSAITDLEDKLDFYKTEGINDVVEAICPECGCEVKEDATFCIRCGAKISK